MIDNHMALSFIVNSNTQKAMIANSDRTVLLMDHTKYNRPSMVRTMDLDGRFTIVTNIGSF